MGRRGGKMETLKDYLRKTWVLWLVIIATLLFYRGDSAQFAVLLYLCGPIAAVLLVTDLILDKRVGWGLFPGLDLGVIFFRGTRTAISCAIMFLGICYVFGKIVEVAAHALKP